MTPMDSSLTLRDLMLPGEPLDPAQVVAGHGQLGNPVSWVVSLRPYPPAFPRLRGGELALVATEHLARLEPPTTLADVVRQLISRDAAALAVRGVVDQPAIDAAQEGGLPLLLLEPDAPLHDIEQAVMRVSALYQARREIVPAEDPDAWVDELLSGRASSSSEIQVSAARAGRFVGSAQFRPATHYSVAYLMPWQPEGGIEGSAAGGSVSLHQIEAGLKQHSKGAGATPVVRPWAAGLCVLLPQGYEDSALPVFEGSRLPCGIGREKPLVEAPASLAEALLAATASALLYDCKPVRYADLGADRLLVLLYRDRPKELEAFVEETIGSLLEHDASSSTPVLPTLQAFIKHGGRLRETAADIYVHRNTLAYRLDRAAEILDVDLKDAGERLAIELALRALPLINKLKAK